MQTHGGRVFQAEGVAGNKVLLEACEGPDEQDFLGHCNEICLYSEQGGSYGFCTEESRDLASGF